MMRAVTPTRSSKSTVLPPGFGSRSLLAAVQAVTTSFSCAAHASGVVPRVRATPRMPLNATTRPITQERRRIFAKDGMFRSPLRRRALEPKLNLARVSLRDDVTRRRGLEQNLSGASDRGFHPIDVIGLNLFGVVA